MEKYILEDFLQNLDLKNIEIIRSVLNGESILDWQKLHFVNEQEVIDFLKLNEIDIESQRDLNRLNFVYKNALEYLREVHKIYVPSYFNDKNPIEVFLIASSLKPSRDSMYSCSILKVMNIINHIDSQDLMNRTPIKHSILANKVKEKLTFHIEKMKELNYPEFVFEWSVKERSSIISKFLTKKEGIVAKLFDRIRFRVITNTKEEIVPVLYYFFNYLFPYNYVIPNETRNNLITLSEKVQSPTLSDLIKEVKATAENQFSGPSYKVLNFIVDIPITLDDLLILPNNEAFANFAYYIYMIVEVQILDKETAENNEKGENSHHLYKERQKKSILKMLNPTIYEEKYEK